MAERLVRGNFVRPDKADAPGLQPQTRNELHAWVHERLRLNAHAEGELLSTIDAVFARHERLWQESNQEAIQALSAGFADKMARVKTELLAKDATVSSIARYFEALVADLTDKSHRDPKTKLMNFGRFTEQLESFLALEQRGRWCVVGLVDIPDLAECHQAHAIGERFREAVERYDWSLEDRRLAVQPVRVDVGVVCLWLGRVAGRRFIARRLAADLIQRADKLMYEAKGERASHIYLLRAKIDNGALAEITDDETASLVEPEM